jgi:hypothetical protein
MLQRINLSNVLNYDLWPYSQAVLGARMGSGISIQMNGIGKVFAKKDLSFENIINLDFHENIRELEISVHFNALTNQSERKNRCCDDIEVFIEYGTSEIESFQSKV